MRKINRVLSYDGQGIEKGYLYLKGKPMILNGDYEFRVYGKAKIGNVVISDTETKISVKDQKIYLQENSAIVFYRVPPIIKEHEKCIEVPDVPKHSDQMEMIMRYMERYAQEKGLIEPEEAVDDELLAELYDDIEEYQYTTGKLSQDDAPQTGTDSELIEHLKSFMQSKDETAEGGDSAAKEMDTSDDTADTSEPAQDVRDAAGAS